MTKVEVKKPNSWIVDLETNRHYLDFIENPPGLQEWNYDGQMVHWIKKDEHGLQAVKLPESLEFLPEDLYVLLNWKAEAKILYEIKPTTLEKVKIGLMVVLAAILIFFVYLILQG